MKLTSSVSLFTFYRSDACRMTAVEHHFYLTAKRERDVGRNDMEIKCGKEIEDTETDREREREGDI